LNPALLLFVAVSPVGPSAAALAGTTAVRLVEDARPKVEVPLERMTPEQLRAEYTLLSHERPNITMPIVATVVGGVGVFGSLVTLLFGAIFVLGEHVPAMLFIVTGFVAVGAAVLLIVGIVTLRSTLAERRPFNERMERLQQQMDRLEGRGVDEGPGAPPPPPPPPPASALWSGPESSVLLARF
jgi:hypothetical protein